MCNQFSHRFSQYFRIYLFLCGEVDDIVFLPECFYRIKLKIAEVLRYPAGRFFIFEKHAIPSDIESLIVQCHGISYPSHGRKYLGNNGKFSRHFGKHDQKKKNPKTRDQVGLFYLRFELSKITLDGVFQAKITKNKIFHDFPNIFTVMKV